MKATLEKLTEQINDEFLTCKICLEPFKQPKCLSCLHTFCKDCIESHMFSYRLYKYSDYRDFSCPICRKKTQIPFGGVGRLQDNFIVTSLYELIGESNGKEKDGKSTCDFCSQVKNEIVIATVKCIDCQKLMCEQCSQAHQESSLSADHDCYELSMEKDVLCPEHPGEPVRYFCDDCEQCVCIVCTCHAADLHHGHRLISFKEAADKRRPYILDSLKLCKSKKLSTDNYIASLKGLADRLTTAQNDIHSAAEHFRQQIADEEAKCLEQLETSIRAPSSDALKRLNELEQYNEQLDNTCSLTELMLSGREIELLLMTKQLSEKLTALSLNTFEPLPAVADSDFRFVKGRFQFGKLSCTDVDYPPSGSLVDIATQTDGHYMGAHGNGITLDEQEPNELTSPTAPSGNGVAATENRRYSDYRRVLSETDEPKSLLVNADKPTKRMRRLIKKNCSVATLPNRDIIILDPECNCMSILDKRGRIKYFLSNDRFTDPRLVGVGNFKSPSVSDPDASRTVTIETPQGLVTIRLQESKQSSLPIGFTVHAYNSMSNAAPGISTDIQAVEEFCHANSNGTFEEDC